MRTRARHTPLRYRLADKRAAELSAVAHQSRAMGTRPAAAPAHSRGSRRLSGMSGRRTSTPGTPWIAGQLGYEPDQSMHGAALALECERMLRQCAKVATVHNRLLDAACSSGLRWEPGSDSPAALRNAQHMNADFGLGLYSSGWLRRSIHEVRRSTIGFAGCGWGYAEVAVDRGADGLWHVVDIYDCCPTAHAQNGWSLGEDGELAEILQASMYGDAGFIDASWALVWSFNRTGDNFEGRGLLRPCIPWFKMLGLAYEMLGIATEKYAVGVPKARIDRSKMQGVYDADLDDMIERFAEIMRAYAAGEEAFLFDGAGFETEIFGQDAFNPERIVSVIKFALEQILSAYLLGMLELGTSAGNYGVGQVLQDAFVQLIVRILDIWCAAFSGRPRPGGGSVLRVLELSYGPQHPNDLPVLRHFGVADDPWADLISHLPHLLNPTVGLAHNPGAWTRTFRLGGVDPERAEAMRRAVLKSMQATGPLAPSAPPSTKNLDPRSGGPPRKVTR